MNAIIFSNPIDLANALAGAVLGFVLGIPSGILVTYFVGWLQRPRVTFLGFYRDDAFNLGVLYKLRFKLSGSTNPGLCCLQIEWPGGSVFGKWDEAPNPLDGDLIFKPELVPATFYQPLFFDREYSIPVIIRPQGERGYEIFSGWWFGQALGYGSDPRISDPQTTTIRVTLLGGGGLLFSKEVGFGDIVREPGS